MTSTPKRRRGTSPTTVILVLLLLGAIAGASRLVTPPPPLPKPETPAPAQPTSAERAKAFKLEETNRKKEMAKYKNKNSGGLKIIEDPNKIEPSNKYFTEVKPGPAGFDQNDKELAKKTAEYKKYLALKAKEPAPAPAKSSEILPPPP